MTGIREARLSLLAGCVALAVAGPATAEKPEAAPRSKAAGVEGHEQALAVARRMSDALAEAGALRTTMEISYDVVQPDGQSLEFGATRRVALRRPDRARIDVVDRSGAERRFAFDGQQIVLIDDAHHVYATAPFGGNLDEMLVHVQDELGLPTPLAEFLSADLYDLIAQSDSAHWVGGQSIDGEECDHVAFRNPETGLQVWVPRKGEALPRRIVIDYERADGRPRFRATLRDWEREPALDDALFALEPPAGYERIWFRTLSPSGARETDREDRP